MNIKVGDCIYDKYGNKAIIEDISDEEVYIKMIGGSDIGSIKCRTFDSIYYAIESGDIKILRGYSTPLYKTINSNKGSNNE